MKTESKSKGKRNRMFETCILLMMAILAVCTVTFTTLAEEDNGSYSLVIKKIFAFNDEIPEEVRTAVKKKEYKFLISGTRRSGDGVVEVNETFTLPRMVDGEPVWESKVYKSEGPFNVTVTELTDNVDVKDKKGRHYNMSNSTTDTGVTISARKHEVELKNNSILTIERPQDNGPDKLWYRVTNRPYDNHPAGNFETLNMAFSLTKGESKKIERFPSSESKLGKRLCAAIYTIEQIAAPEGYQLQLGSRTETVTDNNVGHFHINGTPGRLTLTAGGVENDGVIHVFNIDRTETAEGDTSEFVPRDVRIASGEKYVFDNLPKGGYTVREQSFPEDVNTEFSVVMPQTTTKTKNGMSSAPQKTSFVSFSLPDDITYFKLKSFGPLYSYYDSKTQKKTKINDDTITYDFAYGEGNAEGKIIVRQVNGGPFKAPNTISMNNAAARYPKTPKIAFRTQNVSDPTIAKYIGVSWIEYTEKDVSEKFPGAGITYKDKITVDDRGWMTITAPAPKEDSDASQIIYYYRLEKGTKLITGVGGTTDKPDKTTVMLRAGESVKLEGLAKGSYKITETMEWDYAGFTMQVEGYPFGTTEAGKAIDIQVGGQRDLKISKPAVNNCPEGAADEREYTFNVSGSGFYETVSMKAGESRTVTLPPGEGIYKISPGSDALTDYKMKYTDSGAIYGTASGSQSSITFTNVFSAGEYGYRFVHEYYVKETDGAYVYEGNSPIATRLGRNEGETYQSGEIDKVSIFNSNQYSHFDEAYGWVDPLTLTASDKSESDKKALQDITDSDETEAPDDDETESPDEDSSDTDDSDKTESPDEDSSDTDDSDKTESPDEDSSDTDDGDKTQSPDEDSSDTDDGSGTGSSDGGTADTAGGETGSSDQNTLASVDTEGTESSGKSMLKLVEGKETESDGAETGTSGEDGPDSDDGNDTGSPGEDSSNTDGSGNTEMPGEDGSGPADGEEVPPTEDGSNPADGENTETPGEDGSDTDGGSDTETPGEDGSDSADGSDTETPGEDGSDTDDGGDAETPGEDGQDPVDGENTESSRKDTLKAHDKEEKIESSRTLFAASYDGEGIIDQGVGQDSEGNPLNYKPEADKDHIVVTEEADQIIILRYFRERQPEGKYNVIHVYYRRDQEGDHWEGTSGVRPQNGELGIKYSGNQIEKETSFQPEGESIPYDYIWDGRPQYGVVEQTGNAGNPDSEFAGDGMVYRPNNAWKEVEGTEEGNQIIILRYYRDPNREGYYNIVHEYYFREKGGADSQGHGRSVQTLNEDTETGEEEEDVSDTFSGTLNQNDGYVYTYEGGHTNIKSVTALLGSVHTATVSDQKPEYGSNTYTYIDAGYGDVSDQRDSYSYDSNQQWAAATVEGDEVIILRYYRKAGYKYVHEYYLRDPKNGKLKLVGKSEVQGVTDVSDEEPYTQEDVAQVPEYNGETYTYFDCGYGTVSGEGYSEEPGKQNVKATASEDQIIILRYVQEIKYPDQQKPPKDPEPPTKKPDPSNPDSPTQGSTPGDPDPSPKLSTPKAKDPSSALLVPLSVDAPEKTAAGKGSTPKTGDDNRTGLWLLLVAGALCGLAGLSLRSYVYRKRKGQQTEQR